MKHSPAPQSATSLGAAPRDEADTRVRHYLVMMGLRLVCIVLMVVLAPYGWWWFALFAAGAIFLPYVAVVIANVGQDSKLVGAVRPERELTMLPPREERPDVSPAVLRISESRPADPPHDRDTAA